MPKLNHRTKILNPKSVYENLRWAVEMAAGWEGYYTGELESEEWFENNMICVRKALATLRHKNTKGPKSARIGYARQGFKYRPHSKGRGAKTPARGA